MGIESIKNNTLQYEVGTDGVVSIETSEQGSKRLNMFKVTYADERVLFVGLLEEPKIKYME